MREDTPLALSLALAEAAFEGAPLTGALARIAAAARSEEVLLVTIDHATGRREVLTLRTGEDVLAEYWRTHATANPRQAVWRGIPTGRAVDFDDLVPPSQLLDGPLGALMRRAGFPARHVCGIRLPLGPDGELQFSFGRNREGRFDARAVGLLGALAPHVAAAMQASRVLTPAGGGLAADAAPAAIEALPTPIALIGANGRLLAANAALRSLAGRRDGLGLGRARPFADDARADAALADTLRALQDPAARQMLPQRAVPVPRTGLARPYVVQVIALGEAAGWCGGVAVIVTDPDARPPGPRMLRSLFGLTPAEAELAALLAAGARLAEAARRRGISTETARSQLRAVRGKTGCARQQHLARLLARLAPGGGDG